MTRVEPVMFIQQGLSLKLLTRRLLAGILGNLGPLSENIRPIPAALVWLTCVVSVRTGLWWWRAQALPSLIGVSFFSCLADVVGAVACGSDFDPDPALGWWTAQFPSRPGVCDPALAVR